jgi:hypothetical protein
MQRSAFAMPRATVSRPHLRTAQYRLSASVFFFVVALGVVLGSGCSLRQGGYERSIGELGRFEIYPPAHALALPNDSARLVPHVRVVLLDHGRIESIPASGGRNGIVIAAPHGTFDEHTSELVRRISYEMGVAAVIARGFTPMQTPGWRINVNRPSERHYPGGEIEIASKRARKVYEKFRESVLEAARGELELYVDIHQNGTQPDIEVATVGISAQEARKIKDLYRGIRDRHLTGVPHVKSVQLRIEPVDQLQIGAWAAKEQGILRLARKSLHFELPVYETLETAAAREAYTRILQCLVQKSSTRLSC